MLALVVVPHQDCYSMHPVCRLPALLPLLLFLVVPLQYARSLGLSMGFHLRGLVLRTLSTLAVLMSHPMALRIFGTAVSSTPRCTYAYFNFNGHPHVAADLVSATVWSLCPSSRY